jgi:iron(III) transport system permease protein
MAASVGGSLKGILRRHEQPLLLASAGAIVVLCCALPLARLLGEIPMAGVSALGVLADSRPWILLLRSLLLASVVTVGALLIGAPLGLLIARADLPARRVLWMLHAFPLFLPPFLLALGWFHIFGREGLLGGALTASVLFSEIGLLAILTLTFSPVVTSLVALTLLGMDASLEEAARAIARPSHVARRILLPAARPALALAAIVVFALSVSELGVPMSLRVDVFPAAVFARLGGALYAPAEAFALALPLIPIAAGVLLIERRLVGARAFAVAGLRGLSRTPLPLGRWRSAWSTAAWCIAVVGLLPIGALALRAARGNGFGSLSQWIGLAPWTSLGTAVIAATIIAAVSLVVGHAVARGTRGASTLDAVSVLAFVIPASVLGVGLIAVWMSPATRAIYGTIGILIVGYVARYAVIGIRAATAVMLQSPVHREEAAAASGAGFWRRMIRIVLPANRAGMKAVWLLAAVFCLRDFETAVLYYPPGREPLPVRIFTLEANGPGAVVAALAVTHVLLTAAVLATGLLLITRQRLR